MKSLNSWGNFPRSNSTSLPFANQQEAIALLSEQASSIAHGNGRSYGDSALAECVLHSRKMDNFLAFDKEQGIIKVQAGVLLSEILQIAVPQGWFLLVTPGTKLITVGGALASDVHGKNHHVAGCFSQSVLEFDLLLAKGEIKTVHPGEDLFYATCGGMGLTGVVLNVTLQLKKIQSQFIQQTTIKTSNLAETFAAFEQYQDQPYSVAWIDCLAKGKKLGRSLLMVGDFAKDGDLNYQDQPKKTVPFNFPALTLNKWSVKAFNWLYYHKAAKGISQQKVNIDSFFYPLDAINHWNRIYGKNGFTQYQFILPKAQSLTGLEEILAAIAASGKGSFLAVLKLYGPANNNWLSFPLEGYSLALDFKIEPSLFSLLDQLDEIVVRHQGRIYLAKDARVSKAVFEAGYPHIEKFRQFRQQQGMDKKFNSLQSKRLGL